MNLMKLNGVRGDDENYSRSVQYFGNYIVIIEGANENIVVNEFSLVNPYKPTLTHSVKVQQDLTPLFPIVASYAINSRLFYALMTNQKNGEVFLYAMRYGVTSIESVYKTFKL